MKPQAVRLGGGFFSSPDVLSSYNSLGNSINRVFTHFSNKKKLKELKQEQEAQKRTKQEKEQEKEAQKEHEEAKKRAFNLSYNAIFAPNTSQKIRSKLGKNANSFLSSARFSDPKELKAKIPQKPKIKSTLKGEDGHYYNLYTDGSTQKSIRYEKKQIKELEKVPQNRVYLNSEKFKSFTPIQRQNMDIFKDEKGKRFAVLPNIKAKKNIGNKEL